MSSRFRTVGLVGAGMLLASASWGLNYDVNYTGTAPVIDGTVDAVWSTAAPAMTGFVSNAASPVASTEQTSVSVLWDDDFLYLLYEADDAGIVAPATGSDTGFDFATPQDAADIILDPSWRQSGSGVTNRVYRIAVNPAANAYTQTEGGLSQPAWNLGPNSQVAFSSSGTNWKVELAIAWTELNSDLSNSPGPVVGRPGNKSTWGAQFARHHSPGNNSSITKWHPVAGAPSARPIGTLTFVGAPPATPPTFNDLTPIFSTGFEAPDFTAGNTIHGVNGWTSSVPATFNTTNTMAFEGTQSLGIGAVPGTPQTTLAPAQGPGSSSSHVLQYAVRFPAETPGTTNYHHVAYVTGEYSDNTSKTMTQIWFYSASNSVGGNTIRVGNYITPGNETTVTNYHFPGLMSTDDWAYVTVRTDGVANTFQVWYNDVQLIYPGTDGNYKMRDSSKFLYMSRVNLYNKTYGSLPVFLDSYSYSSVPDPTAAQEWSLFE